MMAIGRSVPMSTLAPGSTTSVTRPTALGPEPAAQIAAALAALTVLAYSVTFALFVKRGYGWAQKTSSTLLLVGGLLAFPVLVALWRRVRSVDETMAATALILGAAGAFGACMHGAYDVATFVNPATVSDGPFPVDPRGFATFGLSGAALVILASLSSRAGLSRRLATFGVVTGLITIGVYIGRLTVLDPNTGLVAACAGFAGFIGTPVWYLGLARSFGARWNSPVAPGP
jgi:hypothetical protein